MNIKKKKKKGLSSEEQLYILFFHNNLMCCRYFTRRSTGSGNIKFYNDLYIPWKIPTGCRIKCEPP
jgi:hypothetical protein